MLSGGFVSIKQPRDQVKQSVQKIGERVSSTFASKNDEDSPDQQATFEFENDSPETIDSSSLKVQTPPSPKTRDAKVVQVSLGSTDSSDAVQESPPVKKFSVY